jgi:phosphatidylserine/phosphatidylglycerophosphate/cardiolipin synthase-like enzyme
MLKRFKASGVEVAVALPVSPLSVFKVRPDLRLHRKIVVIDDAVGYTGSFNLVDPRYFKQDAGVGEWVDAMVRLERAFQVGLGTADRPRSERCGRTGRPSRQPPGRHG